MMRKKREERGQIKNITLIENKIIDKCTIAS